MNADTEEHVKSGYSRLTAKNELDELTKFVLEHDDMKVQLSSTMFASESPYVRVKVTRHVQTDGFASAETSCTRWISAKEVSKAGYRHLLDDIVYSLEHMEVTGR